MATASLIQLYFNMMMLNLSIEMYAKSLEEAISFFLEIMLPRDILKVYLLIVDRIEQIVATNRSVIR